MLMTTLVRIKQMTVIDKYRTETGVFIMHNQADHVDEAIRVAGDIAKREGLTMKWAIELPGISGARVMLTEQIKELIRLIEVEGCRHVVMKETTRLMRSDRYGDYRILDVFIDNGVMIHTPNRSWD